MKNIYHYHTSSNSYWESRWYEHDYFLCDSEEEYQQQWEKANADFNERMERAKKCPNLMFANAIQNSMTIQKEGKVKANEYYYGHEWNGKSFDAVGFGVFEHLERSDHYRYYLRPGSVTNESVSSAVGRPTYYGS